MNNLVILKPVGEYSELMQEHVVQLNVVSWTTISRSSLKKPEGGFPAGHPAGCLSRSSHMEIRSDGKGRIFASETLLQRKLSGSSSECTTDSERKESPSSSQARYMTKNGQPVRNGEVELKVGDSFSALPKHFTWELVAFKREEANMRSEEKKGSRASNESIEILEVPPTMKSKINEDKVLENLECPVCFQLLAYPFVLPPCQHNYCYECLRSFSMSSVGVAQSGKLSCPQGCPGTVSLKSCVLNKGLDNATSSLYVDDTSEQRNFLKRRTYGLDLYKDPASAKKPNLSPSPKKRKASVSAMVGVAPSSCVPQRTIQAKEFRRIRREVNRRQLDVGGTGSAEAPVVFDLT